MRTTPAIRFILVISLVSSALIARAQVFKIIPDKSTVTILGTSNLHDWTSQSSQINGALNLIEGQKVRSLSLDIPVKSIKSKEKLMDKKTYETFDSDKHPLISFRLTEVSNLQINGSEVNVMFNGNLSMAGTTRKVSIKANGKNIKPGMYTFNGSVPIKMTDYKMTPPTALLGALKVGDAIKLEFNIHLEEQTSP